MPGTHQTRKRYDRNAVLDAWAAGLSCRQISRRFGMTRPQAASVIIQRARQNGDSRAALRSGPVRTPALRISLDPNDEAVILIVEEARRRNLCAVDLVHEILRASRSGAA